MTYCTYAGLYDWTKITVGDSSYITRRQFTRFETRAEKYMKDMIGETAVLARDTYWREEVCAYVIARYTFSGEITDIAMSGAVKYKIGDITEDKTPQAEMLDSKGDMYKAMADDLLLEYRPVSFVFVKSEPESYSETEATR